MKQIINKWDILLVAVLLVLSLIPEGIFYMTGNDAAVQMCIRDRAKTAESGIVRFDDAAV